MSNIIPRIMNQRIYRLLETILSSNGFSLMSIEGPISCKDLNWLNGILDEARYIKAKIDEEEPNHDTTKNR